MSVSATTPWPANDASPWIRIGSATDGSWIPAPSSGRSARRASSPRRPGRPPRGGSGSRASVTSTSPRRGAAACRSAPRWYLTSPVPPSAVGDDRVDRPLALELAQDRARTGGRRVREHVQPAAVRHADHDLVRARRGRQLDRLVEHRHHHVEPLERELLLAEERAAQVLLEALDPRRARSSSAVRSSGSSGWR